MLHPFCFLANNTPNPTGLTQAITWVGASSSKYPKAIVKPLFLSSSPKWKGVFDFVTRCIRAQIVARSGISQAGYSSLEVQETFWFLTRFSALSSPTQLSISWLYSQFRSRIIPCHAELALLLTHVPLISWSLSPTTNSALSCLDHSRWCHLKCPSPASAQSGTRIERYCFELFGGRNNSKQLSLISERNACAVSSVGCKISLDSGESSI